MIRILHPLPTPRVRRLRSGLTKIRGNVFAPLCASPFWICLAVLLRFPFSLGNRWLRSAGDSIRDATPEAATKFGFSGFVLTSFSLMVGAVACR